jgi:acyl-CoA ligase (AMP-forming) (exosortase A-associated)
VQVTPPARMPYLLHHLLDGSNSDDQRTAIVHDDTSYSYGDLKRRAAHLATRLKAAGLSRGDRVAIFLPKSFDECAAILAASAADAVFVPINPGLKPAQVRHILEDCAATVLLTASGMMEDDAEGGSLLAILPALTSLLLVDEDAGLDADAEPVAQAIGEDLAAILYTSGSTGRPKGVMLSHRNLLAGTRIVRSYLEIGRDDRILSILPFSFDYGLNQLLTAVEQRATLVLFTFRFGDEIVRAMARYRITGLAGVPTIWAILTAAAPSLLRVPLPDLRYITNSGGAVPTATVVRLRERLPQTRIFLMYGLTEAFRSTFLPPEEIDARPGSIGKAIPECEVFAVTAEGRRARPGEPGVLVHRGPTVSLGYWNHPEETARVLRPHPFRPAEQGGELVCWSGDLVREDEDGYLYFVARGDAMIKSAGYRISPSEVEEVLMSSGAFRQVAVIGLPDAWVGQKVHAVAVPAGAPDYEAVRKAAAQRLPSYMIPGTIEPVESLPINPNGKVDYRRLVEERTR